MSGERGVIEQIDNLLDDGWDDDRCTEHDPTDQQLEEWKCTVALAKAANCGHVAAPSLLSLRIVDEGTGCAVVSCDTCDGELEVTRDLYNDGISVTPCKRAADAT